MLTKKEVVKGMETALILGAATAILGTPEKFLDEDVKILANNLFEYLVNEGNLEVIREVQEAANGTT